MKIADVDIFFLPGLGGSPEAHWQSRWAAKMANGQIIAQADWHKPHKDRWVETVVSAVAQAQRPVVLVGHSVGVLTAVHAAPRFQPGQVAGAFLVGVSDWERPKMTELAGDHGFAPIPRTRLPFPAHLMASRNDPTCDFEKSEDLAAAWGASLGDAQEAGHFEVESGHGPWPEGLMSFASFMRSL